jgi:tRNA-uridine aminocarboxypropyltransferase
MIKIHLLTHQRESERPTNTGQLAIELFPQQVTRIIWNRVNQDKTLLKLASNKQLALIHPSGKPLEANKGIANSGPPFHQYVLLDATWQEAQKILNRTPYLKQLEVFSINTKTSSDYLLRRNQRADGLCTAECVIELFKTHDEIKNAEILIDHFHSFNQRSR